MSRLIDSWFIHLFILTVLGHLAAWWVFMQLDVASLSTLTFRMLTLLTWFCQELSQAYPHRVAQGGERWAFFTLKLALMTNFQKGECISGASFMAGPQNMVSPLFLTTLHESHSHFLFYEVTHLTNGYFKIQTPGSSRASHRRPPAGSCQGGASIVSLPRVHRAFSPRRPALRGTSILNALALAQRAVKDPIVWSLYNVRLMPN